MRLLDEEEQRYYCDKDDQLWLGKEQRWLEEIAPETEQEQRMSPGFNDQEMLLAAKIVYHPEVVDGIRGRYQIIWDQALMKLDFDNIDRAIKIMAEKGWKAISITSLSRGPGSNPLGGGSAMYMYALLERSTSSQ